MGGKGRERGMEAEGTAGWVSGCSASLASPENRVLKVEALFVPEPRRGLCHLLKAISQTLPRGRGTSLPALGDVFFLFLHNDSAGLSPGCTF